MSFTNPTGSPGSLSTGDELMTVAEIAAVLRLNQQTIRNWIDQGRLPAVRIGRRVRIKRSDYEQLLTTAAGPHGRRHALTFTPPRSSGTANLTRRRHSAKRKARPGWRALRRVLVVIAAEQYASRLVVPQSQRSHPSGWSSHKDHAAKALKKLAGPHLPGSLRQLETAVKRAHDDAVRAAREACDVQPAGSAAETESRETSVPTEDGVSLDADGESCDAAGLAESATA